MRISERSAEYWRGRFVILEEAAHARADRCAADLEVVFREAEQQVLADIERWYGRFADNNQISLTEARRLMNGRDLEEFRWNVRQYIAVGQRAGLSPEWQKRLENASARFHISRLEAVQVQIQQQIELLYGGQTDSIDRMLREVAGNGYTYTAYEIQRGLGIGWDIVALDQRRLDLLLSRPWTADNRTFRDRCWEHKANLVSGVQSVLTQGLLRGDSLRKVTDAMQKQFQVSRYKAGRLAHTETTYFNAAASYETYRDIGVEQVEILETLDNITCEICGEFDGMVIPLAQYEPGVTVPPFHPNCRGTTCPHISDADGKRIARSADGEKYYVPADMSYTDWRKAFVEGGNKSGLREISKGGIIKRNYDSDLAQKLGKEHYDQICNQVDACANADLQKIWAKYEKDMLVADAQFKGTAYCGGNRIYLNIESVAKGNSYHTPYSTLFHEAGHAIDGLAAQLGEANGQWHLSSTYQDALFPKTIKTEVDDWVKAILADMKAHKADWDYWVEQGWIGSESASFYAAHPDLPITKSMAFTAVQRKITSLSMMQYTDISDILEGATRNKIHCGIGHGGSSYWTKRTYNGVEWGLGTEAFAEMLSATISNPESLGTIKKYLPKSYGVFEDILGVIAKSV